MKVIWHMKHNVLLFHLLGRFGKRAITAYYLRRMAALRQS